LQVSFPQALIRRHFHPVSQQIRQLQEFPVTSDMLAIELLFYGSFVLVSLLGLFIFWSLYRSLCVGLFSASPYSSAHTFAEYLNKSATYTNFPYVGHVSEEIGLFYRCLAWVCVYGLFVCFSLSRLFSASFYPQTPSQGISTNPLTSRIHFPYVRYMSSLCVGLFFIGLISASPYPQTSDPNISANQLTTRISRT